MATQAEKEAVVQEILDFFQKDGQYGVETCVTQMEHACQAAKKAVDAGSSEDLIIAALLHDIGWKLAMAASVDRSGNSLIDVIGCFAELAVPSTLSTLTRTQTLLLRTHQYFALLARSPQRCPQWLHVGVRGESCPAPGHPHRLQRGRRITRAAARPARCRWCRVLAHAWLP
eukprot:m.38376 g.38376  ORF g.38376 m.38376 type:complete len:172 (+) comp5500_c0_seq2:473-988(+)